MLHLIYRSYGGDNRKGRPDFYGKTLALQSFLRAFRALEPGTAEVLFLNDGPIPAERLALMADAGEVLNRPHAGLRASVRAALDLTVARGWADADLVWFAEDDYLYRPEALAALPAAADAFPEAEYFSLYALIGHRTWRGTVVPVSRWHGTWRDTPPRPVRGHAWQPALSSTGTFGGRVAAIRADRRLMLAALWTGSAYDHTTWLMLHGQRPYPIGWLWRELRAEQGAVRRLRRVGVSSLRLALNAYQAARRLAGRPTRTLVAPEPALITHLETDHLAVGTDWGALARETVAWAAAPSGTEPG